MNLFFIKTSAISFILHETLTVFTFCYNVSETYTCVAAVEERFKGEKNEKNCSNFKIYRMVRKQRYNRPNKSWMGAITQHKLRSILIVRMYTYCISNVVFSILFVILLKADFYRNHRDGHCHCYCIIVFDSFLHLSLNAQHQSVFYSVDQHFLHFLVFCRLFPHRIPSPFLIQNWICRLSLDRKSPSSKIDRAIFRQSFVDVWMHQKHQIEIPKTGSWTDFVNFQIFRPMFIFFLLFIEFINRMQQSLSLST